MNKKLNRQQKIVKELKDKIEHLEYSVCNAQTENNKLQVKLQRYEQEEKEMFSRRRMKEEIENYEIRIMTEIVRWLVNPETAKFGLEANMKFDERNGRF